MEQQHNMPEKLTEMPPSFGAQLGGNYLGSPTVVSGILERFITEIVQWVKERHEGVLSAHEMTAQAYERSKEFARIFSGEDPGYMPIVGWNSRVGGLQEYLKTDLGHYWQSQRASHGDDPYAVFYGWLLWAVVDAFSKSEDDDLVNATMAARIQQAIRLLTGTNRR
jgi:hypothetical protein